MCRVTESPLLVRVALGAKVLQVIATDADDPSTVHAELRYSLRPEGERGAFEIDSITGTPRGKAQGRGALERWERWIRNTN